MKKYILSKVFLGAALVSLAFISCNEKTDTTNSGTSSSTTSTTATSEAASKGISAEGEEVKLNPQHGLPDHRCDLPVGAPLPKGSAATTTPTPAQPQINPNVSPIRVNKNPTVNPPHGEPGHNCAIPVGAPLK